MRGSCSPESHVDDAGAADAGLHEHQAGMLGGHFADDGSLRCQRVGPHRGQDGINVVGRHDGEEFAFVGYIGGIQIEDLAGSLCLFGDRIAASSSIIPARQIARFR